MTHRTGVVAFDQERFLKDVIDEMLEEGNSRYPVYEDDMDNIRGLIHYKDALKFMTRIPGKIQASKRASGTDPKSRFCAGNGKHQQYFPYYAGKTGTYGSCGR